MNKKEETKVLSSLKKTDKFGYYCVEFRWLFLIAGVLTLAFWVGAVFLVLSVIGFVKLSRFK
jgi:hypothetical protein